jgi:NADH-quinone oxidoreductase subunit N
MIHFEVTSQDISLISPLIWIAVTALLVLVVDLFRFDREKKSFAFHLSWAGIVVAFLYDLFLMSNDVRNQAAFGGLIRSDRLAQVFIALILISALLAVFLSRSFMKRTGTVLAEYYVMLLAVVMGMIIIAMAGDLIVLFLGVELLSIPLYVLAAFLRDKRRSVEAGLKYFLLGAFASGFLLYGIVLLYGATGTTSIPQMVTILSRDALSGLSLTGFALIAVGLAFKIAAVPFHMWAPDVYEGAPTPITAFMATGVKIAGFAAIIRIFAFLNTSANETLALGAAWLAVITMIIGNLGALPQTNIKRMLAFSSVAHAGYLLVGLAAGLALTEPGRAAEAYRAILYYLAAYTFMTVGAFGMIIFLKRKGTECNGIQDMAGLAQRHQGVALPMAIFMFTLAGIPPSAGFFGKFYLFKAAVDAGLIWLAVIAVIMSVVSLYYYLRVITTMYLVPAADDSTEVEFNFYPAIVTLISVAGVLILGIFPAFGLNILQSIF